MNISEVAYDDFVRTTEEQMLNRLVRATTSFAQLGLYTTYFVAGCAYLFAESPSLQGLLHEGYYFWAVLMFLGSGFLLVGAVARNQAVEVCGTLPTAFASVVYSVALLQSPPNGNTALAIGGAAFIGVNFWWLVIRFTVIYPNLGSQRRLHI